MYIYISYSIVYRDKIAVDTAYEIAALGNNLACRPGDNLQLGEPQLRNVEKRPQTSSWLDDIRNCWLYEVNDFWKNGS